MSRRSLRKVCARRNLPNFDVYLKGMRENVLGKFRGSFSERYARDGTCIFFRVFPKVYARLYLENFVALSSERYARDGTCIFSLAHLERYARDGTQKFLTCKVSLEATNPHPISELMG